MIHASRYTVSTMLDYLAAEGCDVTAARNAVQAASGGVLASSRRCIFSPTLAQLPVIWNPRMRSAAGRCWLRSGEATRIELNVKLRIEGIAAICETFIHELAHAMIPNEKHSRRWQLLHQAMGGSGTRCHAFTSMKANRRPRKHVATCDRCQFPLMKANALRHDRYTHRGCGGRFVRPGRSYDALADIFSV